MEDKKCHNCQGKGVVGDGNECYYCRGKGYRVKAYGRD